jgi:hypothetical protein
MTICGRAISQAANEHCHNPLVLASCCRPHIKLDVANNSQQVFNALLHRVRHLSGVSSRVVRAVFKHMEWALEDFPGVHDVVEYESRINYMLPKCDMATVCT